MPKIAAMQNLLGTQHAFEQRIRDVHDHLYANANVRTNEAIATEVAKILLALMHASGRGIGAVRTLDRNTINSAMRGDPEAVAQLSDEVTELFGQMNNDLNRYPRGTTVDLDASSTAYVRAQLDGVLFSAIERDWIGDAMEVFRSLDAKRLGGQFFTDQRVTNLSIDLLQFNPADGDDFLDVCTGTGGFLLAAARACISAGIDDPTKTVKGLEVDPALQQVSNGSLVTILPQAPYVLGADSLDEPSRWNVEVRRSVIPGTHRCLGSNPPFGTKITVKDESILKQFELAKRWTKRFGKWEIAGGTLTPRPPDLLFIERNLMLAEPGQGRVALVTPYQVLSGPQLGFVREWILRNARLRAVVDLPADTFQPWTGTKTSLLVMERREKALAHWDPNEDPYEIFMAVASHIGHDRRGNPVINDDGSIKTDLPAIGQSFRAFRRGEDFSSLHPDSFVISSTAIDSNHDQRINAAYYMPAKAGLRQSIGGLQNRRNWRLTTIGELSERIFYPTRFKRNYVDNGDSSVPFYGGSQISQLVPTSSKYLAKSSPNLEELLVRTGWILVTRSGSTGIVSSVPASWEGVAMSEHIIRIVPKESELDPLYIEAYLRSEIGQRLLASGVFGSVIDEITPEHVAEIPILVPTQTKKLEQICRPLRDAAIARDIAMAGIHDSVLKIEATLMPLLENQKLLT
jgi:type I restriction-modification system DNA methylase subunit